LHELNVQLHARGYERLEELLDPAGFSGLLSRAIVDGIHRQSRALDRNEYHNGYPDLVPHGVYPGNSVQHGTKGGLEHDLSRSALLDCDRRILVEHQWGVGLGFIIKCVMAATVISLTAMPFARADDASELVTQALQELSQANADLAQAISAAEASPGNTPAAGELSALGAQNYVQEQVGEFLNSLPTIPEEDETSNQLILTLQYLDGNLGLATTVHNDANLANFAIPDGGQELSIIGDNATAFFNDGSIAAAITSVQLAFDSLGL
jgi:hypothetical protein